MTENKRFLKFKLIHNDDVTIDFGVKDNLTNIYYHTTDYTNAINLGKLLNEFNDENEELKQTIKTICKDYENHHGMDIRNAEWFTAW